MTAEVRSDAPSLAQVRNDATGAGILLDLGVLAMTVGLIRAEAAGDLRILTATGGSRRVARNLTAVTAGTIGLLAAVSGTAIAYLDTAAFFDGDLAMRLSQVPIADLLLVLIALPAAATIGGWLLAGRDQSAPRQRLTLRPPSQTAVAATVMSSRTTDSAESRCASCSSRRATRLATSLYVSAPRGLQRRLPARGRAGDEPCPGHCVSFRRCVVSTV